VYKPIFFMMSLLFVLVFTTPYVHADTNPVTLDALVSEVIAKNPELKFFEAQIDSAKGSRKTAGLWANPEISGSIGQKRVWNEEGELTDKGKAGDLSVSQTFEWPGRIALRQAIADRDIELAELGLEQFRARLLLRAKIAVYELIAAREKAEATREVAGHFRALREVLVQRGQAGLTPQLETRIIEAMEINMQRKASQASFAERAALFNLNQLRGVAPDEDIAIDRMPLEFRPIEKNRDALTALAKSNDYTVRQQAIELRRQGFRVGLAENERMPAVSVGPVISEEKAGDRERVIGAAISLPLPLWDQNQGNIDTAKAERTQAEVSFYIAQREAERRVIEAVTSYETKLKEMAHWQPDSVKHFKEAAELADRHYRLGSVPVSTYIELQTQYLETIEGFQETKKEALQAASELDLLTGADLELVHIASGKEVQ
jgi:cobalt-zinc-cadmium efflux system outer membrane protein